MNEMHQQAKSLVELHHDLVEKEKEFGRLKNEIDNLKNKEMTLVKALKGHTGDNTRERHILVGHIIVHVTKESVRVVNADVPAIR